MVAVKHNYGYIHVCKKFIEMKNNAKSFSGRSERAN